MKNTALVDAGPLIALFDRDDRHHERVRDFLKNRRLTLLSTLPAITEASHLLDFSVRAQLGLIEWIERGGVQLFHIESSHFERLRILMEKYRDAPMDFADASLVVAGEESGVRDIITLDRDFGIYRIEGRKSFRALLS